MFAFQDFHNFTLRLGVVAFGKHLHTHTVAMQGLVGVVGRNEDVFAFFIIKNDVSLARRFHLHRAFHILGLGPELSHTSGTHHIAKGAFLTQQSFVFQVNQ